MTYQEEPTYNFPSIKSHLKHSFGRLLMDLFDGDDLFPLSTSSDDEGLRISTRYPNERKELPSIIISFRGLRIERMTVNNDAPSEFNHAYADTDSPSQIHHSIMRIYTVNGICLIDVMATTDTNRDLLVDKLSDFIMNGGFSTASLSPKEELSLRRIHINNSTIEFMGDSEIPMGSSDGTMAYVDGITIPFFAEVYAGSYITNEPLESIDVSVSIDGSENNFTVNEDTTIEEV